MANELMQKVGELLGMAGVDEEIIKSVTEKLADENVVLEEEQEETVDEAACEIKHEEAGRGTENAPVDGNINQGGEKVKAVEAEDEGKAPVDPKTNVGGVNVAEAEEVKEEPKAEEETVEEAEEVKEEPKAEEETVEESENGTKEALQALLVMVKEAFEHTKQMKADFDVLKEEYAKLVAERIVAEAEDDEVAIEKGEEEDKAEEHKEEEKKDKKEEDEDYKKAHESLDETADKIAEEVTTITEETVVVEPKTVKIAKAFSVFSNNISEAQEVKEEKKQRKAFTLFPNL